MVEWYWQRERGGIEGEKVSDLGIFLNAIRAYWYFDFHWGLAGAEAAAFCSVSLRVRDVEFIPSRSRKTVQKTVSWECHRDQLGEREKARERRGLLCERKAWVTLGPAVWGLLSFWLLSEEEITDLGFMLRSLRISAQSQSEALLCRDVQNFILSLESGLNPFGKQVISKDYGQVSSKNSIWIVKCLRINIVFFFFTLVPGGKTSMWTPAVWCSVYHLFKL